MEIEFKRTDDIIHSCKYDVVWCPKYRRKVLTDGIDLRLKELIIEYSPKINVEIDKVEILPDHVHIQFEVEPKMGVHKAVKNFKLYTGKKLKEEFPELTTRLPSLWTNSYLVSTNELSYKDIWFFINNHRRSQRPSEGLG